jgi:hypothetical protein
MARSFPLGRGGSAIGVHNTGKSQWQGGDVGPISLEQVCSVVPPSAYLQFSIFEFHLPLEPVPTLGLVSVLKGREMPRTDLLLERTVQGWARLNPQQRERFFQAGLKAALRLERREFREWLRRRVSEPPLAAPVDPASFAISQADITLFNLIRK